MKKIKINIDKNKIIDVLTLAVKNKRLLFLIFLGVLLIYNFNVLYNNLYLNINYIDYSDSTKIFNTGKVNVLIKKFRKDIENRQERIGTETAKQYVSPFEFKSSGNAENDNSGGNNGDNNSANYAPADFAAPAR